MGRIFEVRKHTMFARWNRMAKQFARIAKDITMAVKAGGPDPGVEPGPAPRDPERARRQHAEGQGRGGDQARLGARRGQLSARCSTRATRRTAWRCWSRPPRTTRRAPSPRCATSCHQGRRQPRHQRQRQLPVQEDGRVPPGPGRHRPGRSRALPDRSRPRGDGREHRRKRRAAARDPLRVRGFRQRAGGARERAASRRFQPSTNTSARCRRSCPRSRRPKCSTLIDKLEQDDDVQKVFHTLA